jgi:SWI/SNF-related matrix-associated actin-dependent regulator of chromatin subfamily A member 5
MGQKKEVTIYRLITSGTCEERIRFFSQQKLKMKQFVLNEDESGTVVETDLADESADVSKIFSSDQLKDILEYGSSDILEDESSGASSATAQFNPVIGEKFYEACCDSLESQLAKAKKVISGEIVKPAAMSPSGNTRKPNLSPVRRNICIRKFQDEDYSSTRVERTTEMDWLDMMEEERIMQRNRKATTVTIDTHERGLGKIQISKWSIEQEQREKEMMERDRARIEAKKIGGNKRVTEHDMNCLHCRESVLKQRVIVTTAIDEEGKEVKRRRIDTDSSGFQACPICPATMHMSCLRLAVHGLDPTVRTSCPQHKCKICRRSASNAGGLLFRCVDCPIALCYDCIEKYSMMDRFKFIERENVRWERDLGFTAASTYEYMHCPECEEKTNMKAVKLATEEAKMELESMGSPIMAQKTEPRAEQDVKMIE